MHEKIANLIKHNPVIQLLYRVIMSACFRVLGLFLPLDEKLVLLSSMSGDRFDGSPLVLFKEMQKDPRFRDYHYVWAFSNPDQFGVSGAEKVKMDSPAYFKTALRSGIWITDVNIERGLNFKKKKTVYLNTWHGTGPKKGGNAVAGRKDYDFSRVDIFCTDGDYTTEVFVKYWNARRESMLMCGRPREDELMHFTEADRMRIRADLGITPKQIAVLYMPTWREYGEKPLGYSLWERELPENYVLLMRAHHFAKNKMEGKASLNWMDVTAYPNVNELYLAADILVSDYSSAFFDYGLLKKPMLCYAYDYEQFRDSTGLFMDLEKEFPGGIIRSEAELISRIVNMDYETASRECDEYVSGYVTHPVDAAACCLDKLAEILEL